MWMFEDDAEPENFAVMASLVPTLLVCCAIFTMADSVNLTFSFALRGAGRHTVCDDSHVFVGMANYGDSDLFLSCKRTEVSTMRGRLRQRTSLRWRFVSSSASAAACGNRCE